jgi:hypothetical protein
MYMHPPHRPPAVLRFARGFGNVSGTRRTARFVSPALSGRPSRFSSAGPSFSIVHPSVLNSAFTLSVR